jgi:hypothetical protein
MVDTKAYYKFEWARQPELKPLDASSDALPEPSLGSHDHNDLEHDSLPPLTNRQRMLASPRMRGFALESKQWYDCNIESMIPIGWNEGMFSNLVLDESEKELLLALIERKDATSDEDDGFDDFVEGKGSSNCTFLSLSVPSRSRY